MKNYTQTVYRTEQIRRCEDMAIQKRGLSADELMLRAGTTAWKLLRREFPKAQKIAVFCGGGNNAGDGYVLAKLAHEQGYSVTVNQFQAIERLPEPARHAALGAIDAGVICQMGDEQIDPDTDLIVDALLGIGLTGLVREPFVTAINQINDSGLPVLSIDIPSGLIADTGQIAGHVVRADVTVTFIGKKLGQLMEDGPDVCGHLLVDSLQLDGLLASLKPVIPVLSSRQIEQWMPPRPRNCHKGDFGHVLIIGGNLGMSGAVFIAAQTALRVGAGLVSVATRSEGSQSILSTFPELMIHVIDGADALTPLLAKATICLIGPGLGEDEWAKELFNRVIGSHLPMVVDASALRLLAENPQYDDNWVLTPHPGEAASLLHCATSEVLHDRYQAINQLQQQYGGNIVLKGLGSLVCTDLQSCFICAAGNPGMASPGMGDALSGVIAGLISQGLALSEAAQLGVYLHAAAADLAAEQSGERGLLASDLLPFIRQLINSPLS